MNRHKPLLLTLLLISMMAASAVNTTTSTSQGTPSIELSIDAPSAMNVNQTGTVSIQASIGGIPILSYHARALLTTPQNQTATIPIREENGTKLLDLRPNMTGTWHLQVDVSVGDANASTAIDIAAQETKAKAYTLHLDNYTNGTLQGHLTLIEAYHGQSANTTLTIENESCTITMCHQCRFSCRANLSTARTYTATIYQDQWLIIPARLSSLEPLSPGNLTATLGADAITIDGRISMDNLTLLLHDEERAIPFLMMEENGTTALMTAPLASGNYTLSLYNTTHYGSIAIAQEAPATNMTNESAQTLSINAPTDITYNTTTATVELLITNRRDKSIILDITAPTQTITINGEAAKDNNLDGKPDTGIIAPHTQALVGITLALSENQTAYMPVSILFTEKNLTINKTINIRYKPAAAEERPAEETVRILGIRREGNTISIAMAGMHNDTKALIITDEETGQATIADIAPGQTTHAYEPVNTTQLHLSARFAGSGENRTFHATDEWLSQERQERRLATISEQQGELQHNYITKIVLDQEAAPGSVEAYLPARATDGNATRLKSSYDEEQQTATIIIGTLQAREDFEVHIYYDKKGTLNESNQTQAAEEEVVAETIIDNNDKGYVRTQGRWQAASSNPQRYQADYLFDLGSGKGEKSVTYAPGTSGLYELYLTVPQDPSFSTEVPVTITSVQGEQTVTINEQIDGGKWRYIGLYELEEESTITISNEGTEGYVVTDAVKLIKVDNYVTTRKEQNGTSTKNRTRQLSIEGYGLTTKRAHIKQAAFKDGKLTIALEDTQEEENLTINTPFELPEGISYYVTEGTGEKRKALRAEIIDTHSIALGLHTEGKAAFNTTITLPRPRISATIKGNQETVNGSTNITASLYKNNTNTSLHISTAQGAFTTASYLEAATLPAAPTTFKYELLDFTIKDTSDATIRITYPEPLPIDAQYYKFNTNNNTWYTYPFTKIDDYTIELFLVDGGRGDDDGLVNGQISDPGGLGVIEIANAMHLDENKSFIRNIFTEVQYEDGILATIPAGDYVRVQFERALSNKNDITLVANASNATVTVFEVDEAEPLTTFSIGNHDTYKQYLTGLVGFQDTFDLLVSGSAVSFDYITDPPWWNNDWTYRVNITILNSGSTNLISFPAYLDLNHLSGMQTDYDDLRFFNGSCDSNQTLNLSYEIEYYNSTKADIWVKIPTFNVGNNTICLYYGNDAATSGENATGVWDSNYLGVYHLVEAVTDEAASAGVHDDSTSNNNDADQNGNDDLTAVIASGQDLDGTNDYINLPDGMVQAADDFTFSAWVNWDGPAGTDWERVFDFGTGTTVNMFLTPNNGATNTPRFAITTSGGGGEQQITGPSALSTDTWHYMAVTINDSATTGTLYIDGEAVASNGGMTRSPSELGNTNNNWIGDSQYGADPNLDAFLDEIRISDTPRSSDWINQTYQQIENQDTYVNIGTPEENIAPTVSILYPQNTTYSYLPTSLNYTVSSNADQCWYSNGTTNSTPGACNNFTGLTPSQGSNNWTVYANNSYGQVGSDTITFTVDTLAPQINITNPQNTTYTTLKHDLNYTYVEANPDSCWYSLDNGTTNSTPGACNNFTGLIGVSGVNNWTVYINDTSGRIASDSITFTNNISLGILITNPATGSYQSSMNNWLNYTYAGNNIDSCWYSLNNGTTNSSPMTCNGTFGLITGSEGVNTWTTYINNTASEINISSTTFTIDTIPPSIAITDPPNSSTQYQTTLDLEYTVTDNTTTTCWYSLDNGTTNSSAGACNDFTGLSATVGWNTWTVYAMDAANTISSNTTTFNVSNLPAATPLLVSTSGEDLTTDNLTCTYVENEFADHSIVSWYLNGTPYMVLYAPFEGGSSSTATADYSGNGNDGTVTDATWSATSGFDGNGSYDFNDATTDAITFPSTGMLVASGSVSLWANMDSSTGTRSYIFSHRTGANNNRVYLYEQSGTLYVGFADVFTNNIGYTITPDTWHHYVLTWSGAAWKVYVDGVNRSSGSSGVLSGIDANVHIGSFLNTQEWFDGHIDELRVYNRTLTLGQVQAIYKNKTDTILSEETAIDDAWQCSVTSFNQSADGATTYSNILIIKPAFNLSISIDYPANGTYSATATQWFNYTWDGDNIDVCWYSKDGGASNSSTESCDGSFGLVAGSEGVNTWTAYINDSYGRVNSTSTTFTIDTIYPTINITHPQNATYDTLRLDLNYTYNEANPAYCWYSKDGGVTNSTKGSCTNFTGLVAGQGQHNWTVYIEDATGRTNSSSVIFTINASLQIAITTPEINDYLATNTTWLNYTWGGDNIDSCWYSLDGGTTNSSAETCDGSFGMVNGSEGVNTWTVYINNTASEVSNGTISFTIDTTLPTMSITNPQATTYYVPSLDFNYTINEANPYLCWYSLDNGTTNSTPEACTGSFGQVTSSEGTNYWTLYAQDLAGNTNQTSVSFFFNITVAITNIYLYSSSGEDLTTDDLICSYATTNTTSASMTNWLLNGTSTTSLLLPFEGSSATAATDHSSMGNNGTVTGATYLPTGGSTGTGAYDFDGDGDYITVTNILGDFDYQGFSVEAVVNIDDFTPSAEAEGHLFWIGNSVGNGWGAEEEFHISINDFNGDCAGLEVTYTDMDCSPPSSAPDGCMFMCDDTLSLDTWYHVVFTLDGDTQMARLYIDGAEVDSYDLSTDTGWPYGTSSWNAAYIARPGALQREFDGQIDFIKIWNRSLSTEQVALLNRSREAKNLSAQETSVFDQWQCAATPFNQSMTGETQYSNILTIVPAQNSTISITSPANGSWQDANPVWLNYTYAGDNIDKCWYSLDGGTTNSSPFTCNGSFGQVTGSEGTNNWTAYINDTYGRTNSTSVSFTIDTIDPNVTITMPQNITYLSNLTWLNYTLVETNAELCWYSLDGGATNSSAEACDGSFGLLNATSGQQTWTVYANDSAGNIGSDSVTFTVILNDVGVSAIYAPTDNCTLDPFIIMNATVTNYGAATGNVTVSVLVNGSLANSTNITTLGLGASQNVSLGIWLTTQGVYNVTFSASVTGDGDSSNDNRSQTLMKYYTDLTLAVNRTSLSTDTYGYTCTVTNNVACGQEAVDIFYAAAAGMNVNSMSEATSNTTFIGGEYSTAYEWENAIAALGTWTVEFNVTGIGQYELSDAASGLSR